MYRNFVINLSWLGVRVSRRGEGGVKGKGVLEPNDLILLDCLLTSCLWSVVLTLLASDPQVAALVSACNSKGDSSCEAMIGSTGRWSTDIPRAEVASDIMQT